MEEMEKMTNDLEAKTKTISKLEAIKKEKEELENVRKIEKKKFKVESPHEKSPKFLDSGSRNFFIFWTILRRRERT